MFKLLNFTKKDTSEKNTFITMLIFAVIGLGASFTLAVEEFHLLKDPNAILSCSFNLVLNCAAVMKTWQASVFGFPNMFIGLIGYSVVITVAVVALTGARFPRWFLTTANICYGLGLLFAYWLFFNSVYVIQILCPWCLIVTFVTTIIFATITHYNLKQNTFQLSKKGHRLVVNFLEKGYGNMVVASWIVFLIGLVILQFGSSLFA